MNLTPDPIAARLTENGYEPLELSTVYESSGRVTSTFAVRGWHPLVDAAGGRIDYCAPCNIFSVELRYMSARHLDSFSPLATRFTDELAAVLSTGGALVRRTPTGLHCVYRAETTGAGLTDLALMHRPEAYPHGLVASDERAVLSLSAGFLDVPVNDGAVWGNDRSPLTVSRDDLPLWDAQAVSAAIGELVETWVASGELRVCGPYREPAKPDGYWSAEAALARDGVVQVQAVDSWTGHSPGDLGQERGRFG